MISSYVFANGLRIHYHNWNPQGDPVIVMLHGLAATARFWELCAPNLARQGFRILAPDLRGHGLSDKPANGYNFTSMGNDLAAFLDACGAERCYLVAHSWGCYLALHYAQRYSMGPRSPAGLVLVDGGMVQINDIPGATWEIVSQRLAPPHLEGLLVDDYIARYRELNAGWQPDQQVISIILASYEISPEETLVPRLAHDFHMQCLHEMWKFPTFDVISRLRCPMLVAAAKPSETPTDFEAIFLALKTSGISRLQQIQPQAQVFWMENSIHDIPLQNPDALARVAGAFIQSSRQSHG